MIENFFIDDGWFYFILLSSGELCAECAANMNDSVPVQSLRTLMIVLVCAVFLAFFILVTVVAPAEFGYDPTGLGQSMGLTVLAEPLPTSSKTVLSCPAGEQSAGWLDIVVITVPAVSGLEYKFYLEQDAELAYEWATKGSKLYFDFHGEPTGDTTGYFKSFKETTDSQSSGVLKVPFAGVYGWYWENKTKASVRVTLKTKGQYAVKGLM